MKIGFAELIVVFIVALMVIGPDKLPYYARKLGAGLQEFRKATKDVTDELRENVVDPLNEAQQPLREAFEPLEELDRDVRGTVKDMEKSFRDIGKTPAAKKAPAQQPEPEAPAEPEAGAKTAEPEAPAEPVAGAKTAEPEAPAEPEAGAKAAEPEAPAGNAAGAAGKDTAGDSALGTAGDRTEAPEEAFDEDDLV